MLFIWFSISEDKFVWPLTIQREFHNTEIYEVYTSFVYISIISIKYSHAIRKWLETILGITLYIR